MKIISSQIVETWRSNIFGSNGSDCWCFILLLRQCNDNEATFTPTREMDTGHKQVDSGLTIERESPGWTAASWLLRCSWLLTITNPGYWHWSQTTLQYFGQRILDFTKNACSLKLLPRHANIFRRIYPAHPWHLATLIPQAVHYRLRCPIGFRNVQKVDKSRCLFLSKKTPISSVLCHNLYALVPSSNESYLKPSLKLANCPGAKLYGA